MIASIPSLQPPDRPPGLCSESTVRRPRIVRVINRILDIIMVAVITAATLYLLDDGNHAARSTAQVASAVSRDAPKPQMLPGDPRDAAVTYDLATVLKFRDAIARELTSVNSRFHSGASQAIDIRRRYTMEKILSNDGRSGLNDRIAEIGAAIRLRSSSGFDANRDQASITQAIQNLHDTAISCRSGALAAAAAGIEGPIGGADAAQKSTGNRDTH